MGIGPWTLGFFDIFFAAVGCAAVVFLVFNGVEPITAVKSVLFILKAVRFIIKNKEFIMEKFKHLCSKIATPSFSWLS